MNEWIDNKIWKDKWMNRWIKVFLPTGYLKNHGIQT